MERAYHRGFPADHFPKLNRALFLICVRGRADSAAFLFLCLRRTLERKL
jgi:hypothetical protein